MSELYWITRLGHLHIASSVIFGISGATSIFLLIGYFMEDFEEELAKIVKGLKRTTITAIISGMICLFCPSTKEALIIYGIGGSIDYIQQNPTAQKLPDKVIKALDKYLDEEINGNTNRQN